MYQTIAFFIVFCLMLNGPDSYGQTSSKVDSLKAQLSKLKGYETSWQLAYELWGVDDQEALMYGKAALQLAKRDHDTTGIIKSGRITGQILRRVDNVGESIEMLSFVLPISEAAAFDKETMLILNGLAISYSYKAEYDKALEYHFRCLVLREKEQDPKQLSISLNNIGLTYYFLESLDMSLEYYLRSLRVKEQGKITFDLDRLYVNIGLCYNGLGDYKNAEVNFNKAFETCGADCNNQILMEGEFGRGHAFFGQKNYNEAYAHFDKSYSLSLLENDQRFQVENLIELGRLSLELNNPGEVLKHIKKIEELPEIQYRENLLKLHKLRADYYTRTGDFEKANLNQQKYSTLKDSIYAKNVLKNLNQVQTKFAQRENLAIIASKDEVLDLNTKIITQQRVFNWLLGAVVLLTSVLGVSVYFNNKRIRAVNGALATAKQVIEDQNHLLDHQVKEKTRELIDTNESLVKVNDELDNFIYKTSHDIRGPLASLKGMVNLAIMDVKDEKALIYLSKLDLTAEKLNTVLTRLLIVNSINHAELKPEVIHFEPIIQEILRLEMKKGIPEKIKIDYEVSPDINLVSDPEMVRLIMENLIDNAIKFYDDADGVQSFVKIIIKQETTHVKAQILDNGTGIAAVNKDQLFQMFVRASERSETGGIGLYLAKLASEKLGGDINLVSTNQTTEFIVLFPNNLYEIIDRRKEEKKKLDQEKLHIEGRPLTGNS